jgi:signal transduction histidine kinase
MTEHLDTNPGNTCDNVLDLPVEYSRILREYVFKGEESSLHQAYQLGRQALASGIGLLELVNIHHVAASELSKTKSAAMPLNLRAADHFLMESISPYQMMQSGHKDSNAALRRLNGILEEEAKRIAHILHDEAAQLLAVVYLELAEILHETPSSPISMHVENITLHLNKVLEQLRRLSHELRPPILDHLGLLPALRFLRDGFQKRTNLVIKITDSTNHAARFSQAVETAVYRAVQEALNNVARHADATHVTINIWSENDMLHCSIKDDGVGFVPTMISADTSSSGLGLLGINERLRILHGNLIIRSALGAGTTLHFLIPEGHD